MKQKLLKFVLTFAVLFALFVIPQTVNAATEGVFTYENYGMVAAITGCSIDASGDIVVPETLGGYPVSDIEEYAFSGCESITSITLPKSIEYIASDAFDGCFSLENIYIDENNRYYCSIDGNIYSKDKKELIRYSPGKTDADFAIPTGVTNICGGAFCDSIYLTKAIIPSGVTSIGSGAFAACDRLSSITMPDSLTNIGARAFIYCEKLESIVIPDSVTSIGYYAFENTGYFNNSNNWENNVLYIGNHLIRAKETISGDYAVKSGTKTIAGDAFCDCYELTGVTIPDGVISIGEWAFSDCEKLISITIPDSVTSIGVSAFDYTAYVDNSSNWENDVLYIGNHLIKAKETISGNYVVKSGTKTIAGEAFNNCAQLSGITIPESVISIGDSAFLECIGLADIILSNGVKNIEWFAFAYCENLKSITIPESVMSIGERAFLNCSSLTYVTILNKNVDIGNRAFSRCFPVIYGYKGSTAEKYAYNEGFEFEFIDAPDAPEMEQPTVTAESYVGNQTIIIYADISKEISDECLHIALYNSDDALVDYIIIPPNKPFDNMNVAFKDDDNAAYAKVFLWENMISTQPIADAVKVDIER